MLKIIKVTGSSLSPFFLPGDYVLVNTYRSHENSISSHKLGFIPYSDLIGKVIFHIKQPRTSD